MYKNLFKIIVLFSLLFISCASTNNSNNEVFNPPEEIIEIPKYCEWRYQGFGQEIPEWFDYAVTNDIQNVLNSRNDLSGYSPEEIFIVTGNASNGDQAEQFIKSNKNENNYIDSFWAKPTEFDENNLNSYIWVILIKNS